MKTASLGLLEVLVVCANGGDAPQTPPLLVTSWAIPPFFVFFKKNFFFKKSFMANKRNIFGEEKGYIVGALVVTLFQLYIKSSAFGVFSRLRSILCGGKCMDHRDDPLLCRWHRGRRGR
jgi:hypothetical protein